MQFQARTLSADNLLSHTTLEATDEADARRQLAARGLYAASLQPASSVSSVLSGGWIGAARAAGPRAGRFSLLLLSQELLALLQAGLSLVEALEALLDKDAGSASAQVLGRVLADLREGRRFSDALALQPGVFPPLFVGIVRTAEGTSDLPRALERFIAYLQRVGEVRQKVVSAAVYPAILLAVGGGVSAFLIGYVVPRFAQVYEGSGRPLPWMSQALLDAGQFVSAHFGPVLALALGSLFALFSLARQGLRRHGWAGLLARLPGVGERVRIYELSRLYLTLGMLNEGGVPLVAALGVVQDMVSPRMRERLRASRATIESGAPLSAAFEAQGLTTPISLRLLRVGERSGELGALLLQSASFYDGEIARWIDRFTRMFEPLLMAAIGIVVGLIVVLLYMPIFDLAGGM